MPNKLGQPNDNRRIEPLNRHPQFLRWKLLIICSIEIQILTRRTLNSFHMVYLLHHMLDPAAWKLVSMH